MELKVDKEFESLIPPLSKDEFKQLTENILKEGIRDPIIVWAVPAGYRIIIDGHNRYKIANKHNIPFEIKEMRFESRGEVKEWIIRNQFGRRNLSAYDRSILALKLKPVLQAEAKERQGTRTDKGNIPQKSAESRDELARIAGVSHDTIHKVEKIEAEATDKTKQLVREGKLSINQAYNSVHPKRPDPVQKAKEEHEEFIEKKSSAVVDFQEMQVDKANQRIINNAMVQDILKLTNTITNFAFNNRMEVVQKLSDDFTDEFRSNILKELDKSRITIEVLIDAIRR